MITDSKPKFIGFLVAYALGCLALLVLHTAIGLAFMLLAHAILLDLTTSQGIDMSVIPSYAISLFLFIGGATLLYIILGALVCLISYFSMAPNFVTKGVNKEVLLEGFAKGIEYFHKGPYLFFYGICWVLIIMLGGAVLFALAFTVFAPLFGYEGFNTDMLAKGFIIGLEYFGKVWALGGAIVLSVMKGHSLLQKEKAQ